MQGKKKQGREFTPEQLRQRVFVGHEFTAGMIDDLRQAVDGAIEASGLVAYYTDKELVPGKQIFLEKILPVIHYSAFGIYDISNPKKLNVFLELGAGLARRKACVITCKSGTNIPSNLRGLDRIEYRSFGDLGAWVTSAKTMMG